MKIFKATIAVILLATGVATAQPLRLFGTVNAGGTSTFVELNPNTGALVGTIGPVGYQVNGLTWDRTTRAMYASTSSPGKDCPVGGQIIRIDLSSGAGTLLGVTGLRQLATISASPDGRIFGWGDCTVGNSLLATVDKSSGAATVTGYTGLDTLEQTFAFDGKGVAYLLNGDPGHNLYTINTVLAAPTLLGPMASNPGELAFHHGTFHPATGLLYTIDRTNFYSPANPRNIRVVDVGTRTIVNSFAVPDNLHTIAFVPGAVGVPAMSPGMLALLAALLTLSAAWMIAARRRHRR